MKKVFGRLFLVCLTALVALSLAGLALWRFEGLNLYSVQTDSMAPALRPGDLAISIKTARPQPGDIISYRSGSNSSRIVSHRVIAIYPAKGYLITKGDNLAYPDPAVPYSSVTGKTVKVVPAAGRLIDFIHQPAGLIALVYLPGLAIAAYELNRVICRLRYRPYGAAS